MALTAAEQAQIEAYNQKSQKKDRGVLEVTAMDYYFEKLRPDIEDFNKNYHTDLELNKALLEVINHADSLIAVNRYLDFMEEFDRMLSVVNGKNYLKQHMADATSEEKEALSEIKQKIENIRLIIMSDNNPVEEEEKPKRERLNYQEPNGEIRGHNKDDLSNRLYNHDFEADKDKLRIPNIESEKINIH